MDTRGKTMRRLHLEKKGIRGLAIAESFMHNSQKSVLAGIVISNDFLIDGFVFGSATIKGDDATDQIISMYKKLERPDICYIIISGIIISLYNMVDIKKIYDTLMIPVIGVTYADSSGLEETIKKHFPENYDEKIKQYAKIGNREKISLNTSHDVYVRIEGCTENECKQLLNKITVQGAIPEPLRVSHLLAKSILTG